MSEKLDYVTLKLKKSDTFGHVFRHTYENERLFTTWCGAAMTTTLNVIVLFYACVLFASISSEREISQNSETRWFDLNKGDGFNF
jgi:hypothetical protein